AGRAVARPATTRARTKMGARCVTVSSLRIGRRPAGSGRTLLTKVRALEESATGWQRGGSSVRGTAVGGRGQVDHVLAVVDLVEEPPGADAVPPSVRGVSLKLPDVRTVARMARKLGINDLAELADDLGAAGARELAEVLLKLLGLEDPILTQRNVP